MPHGRVAPWPLWNKQLNHWILMDSEGPDFDILRQLNRCKQDILKLTVYVKLCEYVQVYSHTYMYIYI